MYIKIKAFKYKGKVVNVHDLLPGIHKYMHDLAMVVGILSNYPPIHMHMRVQDALLE